MPLIDFHSRCRDTEAALRGRISDLEDRESQHLDRISELMSQILDLDKSWAERYTSLLNPAAARMQAQNQRIVNPMPYVVPPTTTPAPEPELDRTPDSEDAAAHFIPPPKPDYSSRTSRVRPMPIMTPRDVVTDRMRKVTQTLQAIQGQGPESVPEALNDAAAE